MEHTRRNPTPEKRRLTRISIPERVGPHVKLVFAEMSRRNLRYDDVVAGSGVQRAALKAWRRKNRPSLESIEAVLNFLGYDFIAVPRAKVLPPEIVRELQPIADRLGLTMEQTIQALIEIVTGIHAKAEKAQNLIAA